MAASRSDALLIAVTGFGVAAKRMYFHRPRITPAERNSFDRHAKAGPILNDYNFGGYLDFVGIPPFIDGRAELYGEAYMLRHDRALSLQNLPDFLRLLDEYRVSARRCSRRRRRPSRLLDRLPDWQRIYADDIAVVHLRR